MSADGDRLGAILLAAGASTRMGRNKMLVELGGETLVHRASRRAVEAGLDPLVVVVGHEADRVRAALRDLPCTFATNPSFRAATSASLHSGLAALPPDTDGAVVLLADMVGVTTEMLTAIRDAARPPETRLVVSRYGSVIAPPLFFRRALFPELLAWSGDGPGKGVARRYFSEAVTLDWTSGALVDVDTPGDLERLAQRRG